MKEKFEDYGTFDGFERCMKCEYFDKKNVDCTYDGICKDLEDKYANVILKLINKIEFLEGQNKDLDKSIHEKKLRIAELENGLEEIRKYIENSAAPQNIKEMHVYEMTIKLSYPDGF